MRHDVLGAAEAPPAGLRVVPSVGALRRSLADRLRRSLARGSSGLMILALLTGVGAGLGAVAFRYLIVGFTYAFTGRRDYSPLGHVPNPTVPSLGIWFVALAPVLGGLIYGPLVARFAPEARGHGVPEVMLAVNRAGAGSGPRYPWSNRSPQRCASGPEARSGARGRSCRSGRRSARSSVRRPESPSPSCGCSSPAGRRAESRPHSTHRSPACSSRWS